MRLKNSDVQFQFQFASSSWVSRLRVLVLVLVLLLPVGYWCWLILPKILVPRSTRLPVLVLVLGEWELGKVLPVVRASATGTTSS
jgi:hypothetical protein